MITKHKFHIPVMGTGFTIDTPIKVAKYGIDSVISIVDDFLMERMRKSYCEKNALNYDPIDEKQEDYRARRITSYLNLVQDLVENKMTQLKNLGIEKTDEITDYLQHLPNGRELVKDFFASKNLNIGFQEFFQNLKDNLNVGSIDVNIMTKIDKVNYKQGKALPLHYNDSHAALRGFAQSKLNSSVVLSAGMNPRLYSYFEEFDAFYPKADGSFEKKIILKVSDYRSALIQGKFFAKKGLWISEYRVESGLNCGGHAFATDGLLLGPILEEFVQHRDSLQDELFDIMVAALEKKGKSIPSEKLSMRLTVQGGVGTAQEQNLLMNHYGVDSVGWGSPFLLVPEATSVDDFTRNLLIDAQEDDLYLSKKSPLGVPFNSVKGSSMDFAKQDLIDKGKSGSPCPKRFLISNTSFTEKPICTASYRYQKKRIAEIESSDLSPEKSKATLEDMHAKSCLCVGLANTALLAHGQETKFYGGGVAVCPGPNIAYFSKKVSLKNMIDHIYGESDIMNRKDRPNMFSKEMGMYMDYLKEKIEEYKASMNLKQGKSLIKFVENMKSGIQYYQNLLTEMRDKFDINRNKFVSDLEESLLRLQYMQRELVYVSERPKVKSI